ncbi:MAG: hypothetical protein JXR77_11450 [Lentisphaeria bacterium]|nr:hypothetical protein [Lentisphaeria bacterium]
MMRFRHLCGGAVWFCFGGIFAAEATFLIGAPDCRPTPVDGNGALGAGWGSVGILLTTAAAPEGLPVSHCSRSADLSPTVLTVTDAAPIRLEVQAYRAPIWPAGVNVLDASVRNGGERRATACLALRTNAAVKGNETGLLLGSRAVVALPPPPPVVKASGCLTAAEAMPGWGHPDRPCDASFRSIRAGMGGIPITYRFAVAPSSSWLVALGFCESHWAEAGKRPFRIRVEGAPERVLDPVAEWGQHVPGCTQSPAVDADADGWLEISILPKPGAPDLNPILNTIWIFAPGTKLEEARLLRGELNRQAASYTDVGGGGDGPLTEPGRIRHEAGRALYDLDLDPGAVVRLTFLVAMDHGAVPLWGTSAWTPESLRGAADGVWGDWFAAGSPPPTGDESAVSAYRCALADIVMCRQQADGYFAALAGPGSLDLFSHAACRRIVAALDAAGFHVESERMVRLYWDRPLPAALRRLDRAEDGPWSDPSNSNCPHAQALLALAEHAAGSGDAAFAARVHPALVSAARWLCGARENGQLREAADLAWGALALRRAAQAAELAGHADDARRLNENAAAFGSGTPDEEAAYAGLGPCVEGAGLVLRLAAGKDDATP